MRSNAPCSCRGLPPSLRKPVLQPSSSRHAVPVPSKVFIRISAEYGYTSYLFVTDVQRALLNK